MTKMHENEFHIDESLVRNLILQQFPHWAHESLRPVSSCGTDNALYRLGKDKLIRLPRIHWAVKDVAKECQWLPKIAPFLPVSIPFPLEKGTPTQEYPYPWSIYNWLEGNNPLPTQVSEILVDDLILFIQSLHKLNLPNGPLSNRSIPLEKKDQETKQAIQQLEGMIDAKTVTTIWEKTLKAPQWSKPSVWIHGDLSPGNLLIQEERLSAVIDFGSLGMGDPALDLIIAWNLLPSHMRQRFRYGLKVDDATWERGRGWALSIALIQLPYYKYTNPILAKNAEHVIQELIHDDQNPTHNHQR